MTYFQKLNLLYIGARGIFVSRAVVAEVVRVLLYVVLILSKLCALLICFLNS